MLCVFDGHKVSSLLYAGQGVCYGDAAVRGLKQRYVVFKIADAHSALCARKGFDAPKRAALATICGQDLKPLRPGALKAVKPRVGLSGSIAHALGRFARKTAAGQVEHLLVANVADRVAVLYAGQVVELGTVEEVFYDPRHPYTWALLSSLPQLAEKGTELYSITGTPPSLYNKIKGDAFAPRNPYCLKLDTLEEPPMFRVSETHYAKTWLLDPRAPKVEKPSIIGDIHGKLVSAYHLG